MSEAGHCPTCGSWNIDYGSYEMGDDEVSYEVDCSNCGWSGKEVYELTFMEHVD